MIIRTVGMWYSAMHVRKQSSGREMTKELIGMKLFGEFTTDKQSGK